MQLPEILGTSYILPVIIVVLLLAGIAGLLILNQRKKARASGSSGGQSQKLSKAEKAARKAPPLKATRESRKADALAARAERDAGDVLDGTQPTVYGMFDAQGGPAVAGEGVPEGAAVAAAGDGAPAVPLAPAAPSATRAGRQKQGKQSLSDVSPTAVLAVDPLQRVIASILQGWGDITADDTSRLSVFRADKVVAALAAIEVPKEGKGNEYARARLTQLRRFAGQMEQTVRPAAVETEVHEFAGIGRVGGAPAGLAGPAGAGAAGRGTAAMSAPAAGAAIAGAGAAGGAAAGAGALADIPKPVEPPAAAPTRKSWYSSEHEEVIPVAAEPEIKIIKGPVMPQEWKPAPVAGDDTAEVISAAAEMRRAEFDWGAGDDDLVSGQTKAVDLTWGHGQADEPLPFTDSAPIAPAASIRETVPEMPFVEAAPMVETPAAAPPAAPEPNAVDEASRSAEAAVAAAAAAFWGTPDAVRLERSAGGLGKNVGSAADVLALPAEDQAEMLPFLDPGELTKVFRSTGDKHLKKAVIDTLEHVGNTSSLDAIHACLEDPDAEVQFYALNAAERMLGKMS
jgi:hypothetical protein